MNIEKNHINFAVGPVQMSDEIKNIGAETVPYFRTPDFSALMKENEALMKDFVNAPESSRTVFLTGSGTAAMEASVINLFDSSDRLLVVNGGSFGHRFCEICDVYGIPYDQIIPTFGDTVKKGDLDPFEGKKYSGLLVNMHETSTGVLYDMELLGNFCRRNGIMLIVDAISAFIADDVDMQRIGADIVLTGSQKALAVPPGISIIVMSDKAVARTYDRTPVCYYLDLRSALKNGERGQTPFTPAVGILIQINARLNQIARDTLAVEQARVKTIADDFRARIAKYPFDMVSSSPSNAVTSLAPKDKSLSAYSIFEILKNEYNIIVCPNGGELAQRMFRVGHIGHLTVADNDALFAALDDLAERKII